MRRLTLLAAATLVAACSQGPGASASTVPTTPTPTALATPGLVSPAASAQPSAPSSALTWHAVAAPAIPVSAWIGGIARRADGDPRWVAVGVSDFAAASSSTGGNWHLGATWISSDGTTWSKGTPIETAVIIFDVAYGASTFVAVGGWSGPQPTSAVSLASYAGGYPPGVWTSPDGNHWTGLKLGPGIEARHMAYGDAGFVVIGTAAECSQGCSPGDGVKTPIFRSKDGLAWTSSTFDDGLITDVVASPNGGYVAIGQVTGPSCPDGTSVAGAAWQSADGSSWTRALTTTDCASLAMVGTAASGWVLIGATPSTDGGPGQALSWTSADGHAWTGAVAIDGLDPSAVSVLGIVDGTWVLSGGDGIWELHGTTAVRSSDAPVSFNVFGGGVGLAVGENGGLVPVPQLTH